MLSKPLSVDELTNAATFAITCEDCRKTYMVEVDYQGYCDWLYGGKLLQHALPHNTHDERELLLSHTCGPCYDALFTEEIYD